MNRCQPVGPSRNESKSARFQYLRPIVYFCMDLKKRRNEMIPEIRIEDYNYDLPGSRIAKYPLPQRDSSKLLHYDNGHISDHVFRELPSLLDSNSLMIFNETRVVPARLHFQRETGANIEIFCLEPVSPAEYNLCFSATSTCRLCRRLGAVPSDTSNARGRLICRRP